MTTLDQVRAALRRARDLKLDADGKEAELKRMRSELQQIESETLPALFEQANIDQLGLPAEGNMPAYDCQLKPYYRANIAANWPQPKREAAFSYLEEQDAASLIKTVISIKLPMDSQAERDRVIKALNKLAVPYDVKLDVPWASLTSWLKESVERGKMPDLEVIGATVGQVVKLTERE